MSMFENQVSLSMFLKVFAFMAILVAATMPLVFKNMKREGARFGFLALYSTIASALLVSLFAGHLVVVANSEYIGEAWVTYLFGINTLIVVGLFYCYYLRWALK